MFSDFRGALRADRTPRDFHRFHPRTKNIRPRCPSCIFRARREHQRIDLSPSGPGPHPTLIICHGLPGNERISISRKPSAVPVGTPSRSTIGDRGQPRQLPFRAEPGRRRQRTRVPAHSCNRRIARIDTRRIAIAGHSMADGWWLIRISRSRLIGAILISAGDMGLVGEQPLEKLVPMMADDMESWRALPRSLWLPRRRRTRRSSAWTNPLPD